MTPGWVGHTINVSNENPIGDSAVRNANKLRAQLYQEQRRQSAAQNSCFFGKPRTPEPPMPLKPKPKQKISMLKFYVGAGEENLFADGAHRRSFNTRPTSRAMPPLQEMDSKPPIPYDPVAYSPGPESMFFQAWHLCDPDPLGFIETH